MMEGQQIQQSNLFGKQKWIFATVMVIKQINCVFPVSAGNPMIHFKKGIRT